MKLKKFKDEQYVSYWHNNMPVELGEYKYREQDLRGVWVSTVFNIDVPKCINELDYKDYLKKMVENIASYNINTIVFQVRPSSDAFYQSKLNPWSRFITGSEGKNPGFDVLEFVIEEAKKYNIKVHAWMNPYRVSSSLDDLGYSTKEEYLNTLDDLNFAKRYPEHTILDGKKMILLSPSHPEVIEFVTETIKEVIENYDIEGVHIDDYFYPYAKIPQENEWEDYLKYRLNDDQTFADFRRYNVDLMIENISKMVKKSLNINGNRVLFGISPFGVYRTNKTILDTGWEKGSYHSNGALQAYDDLYSDIYKWMKEHWIDYVVPQLYFPFERQDVTYHDLAWWWHQIASETNTLLYIGQGLYQMGSNQNWENPNEIKNQLIFNCQFPNINGVIFFTYRDLVKGQNSIKDQALDTIKELWCQKK